MSVWIYKKEKDRKTSIYLVEIPFLLITIILGLFAALIVPKFLMFSGFFLLLIAKISLFRKGIWRSFVPGLMSDIFKQIYYLGYILSF